MSICGNAILSLVVDQFIILPPVACSLMGSFETKTYSIVSESMVPVMVRP